MGGDQFHRLIHAAPTELFIALTRGAINIVLLTELRTERNRDSRRDARATLISEAVFQTRDLNLCKRVCNEV